MAIHLITAVPGAGKTLRAIWMTLKMMEEQPDRPVFSNINAWKRAAPIPEEWMDCPDGSLIVLDECQQRWRRYRATGEPPPEITALETHRHRGIDFILTCQNPQQITADVRGLVEVQEHLTRKGKMGAAIVHRWDGVCHANPHSHKRDAEVSIWRHPKEVFAEYQSATIHTGKRRLPRILIIAPGVLAATFAAVAYAVSSLTGIADVHTPTASQLPDPAPSFGAALGPAAADPSPELVTARGGVIKGDVCVLYDDQGKVIITTYPDCLEALDSGLPFDVERLSL